RGAPETARPGGVRDGLVRVIGPRTFDFTREVAVMAIVNRTRDSFYDRGRHFALSDAIAAADRAVRLGADWVDVGAVPFSPHSAEVGAAEEIERLLPLVRHLVALGRVAISVDTFRPEVADACVRAGAHVINDTSGLRDPAMAEVAAGTGATLVITHTLAAPRVPVPAPQYGNVVDEVRDFLASRVAEAVRLGVRPEQLVIDPGHDLHKNTLHSLELTRRLAEIADLPYPLLASVSKKDFVQEVAGRQPVALTAGTVTTLAMCVAAGARVVRVHDVAAAKAAVTMISAVHGWHVPERLRHNRD
ncbi:MAG: dihydropteroate synthase, partial [Kineosporiaceae bacterium]